MSKSKKLLTSAIALGTAAAMVLGGTFAWQSISQTATNEASDIVNPGGRLHNDLTYIDAKTTDANIYVENFTEEGKGEDIFARVRLSEYMEIVMNYGSAAETVETVAGSKTLKDGVTDEGLTDDSATQRNKFDYEYAVHYFGLSDEEMLEGTEGNKAYTYWTLNAGTADSEAVYMPTFNKNKDSLAADLNGLYNGRVGGITNRGAEQYDEGRADYEAGQTEEAWAIYDADYNTSDELGDLTIDQLHQIIYGTDGDIDGGGENAVSWNADAFGKAVKLLKETHTAANVGETRGLIALSDWLELDEDTDNYWVYDDSKDDDGNATGDGWVYWSSPIKAGETTGLLLDGFKLNGVMDDTWYYAIDVEAQFVTANDVGKGDNTGFYADGETVTENAETLLENIGVDMSGEVDTDDDDEPGENGSIDSLNVSVAGDRNWYSATYSTTDPITLTVSGKWYQYSPWTNGEVDESTLETAKWTLTGNISESTTLSASTGKTVTLTLGEGEEGELEVSAELTYGGKTATGSETIYSEPHVGSFNLYTTDNQYLSATAKYQANSTTTYQLMIFPKYLGDLSKYDPNTAYTGEVLKHLVDDLSFALAEDTEDAQETTIDGVTLTQDSTDKSKVTLTIGPDVKENFRIIYKWDSGGSGYNAFRPIPAFTALTNAAASDNKVELAAGESTEFKLEGQFTHYDVNMSITGHKANGDELAEVLTFDVSMDYNDPTKVTVTHTCSTDNCTCDAELAYCTLTATAIEYPETTITSEVKIYNKAAEEPAMQVLQLSSSSVNVVAVASQESFTVTGTDSETLSADHLTVTAVQNGESKTLALNTDYTYSGGTLTITNSDLSNAYVCVSDNAGNKGYVHAAKGEDAYFLLHTGSDHYYEAACAPVNTAVRVETQTYGTPVETEEKKFEVKTVDGLGEVTLTSGTDYQYNSEDKTTLTITNDQYANRVLLVTFDGQGGYIFVTAAE